MQKGAICAACATCYLTRDGIVFDSSVAKKQDGVKKKGCWYPRNPKYQVRNNYALSMQEVRNMGSSGAPGVIFSAKSEQVLEH